MAGHVWCVVLQHLDRKGNFCSFVFHPVIVLLTSSCSRPCSGSGWAKEEVLEVAHSELPELHQTTTHVVRRDQHHHADFCSGQIQPQRSAGLRDARPHERPHAQQRLHCLRNIVRHRCSCPVMLKSKRLKQRSDCCVLSAPLNFLWYKLVADSPWAVNS